MHSTQLSRNKLVSLKTEESSAVFYEQSRTALATVSCQCAVTPKAQNSDF